MIKYRMSRLTSPKCTFVSFVQDMYKKEANVILGLLTGSAFIYLSLFYGFVVLAERDEPRCNE